MMVLIFDITTNTIVARQARLQEILEVGSFFLKPEGRAPRSAAGEKFFGLYMGAKFPEFEK